MESTSQSATPSSSRKRPRENETEGQRQKREKAAERQRRKRERDRNINAGISVIPYPPPVEQQHLQQHQVYSPSPNPIPIQQSAPPTYSNQELSPEEKSRRDRVRAAARERQRKHRLLVKQRKMRELGLDMGNEIPGMEDPQYRVNGDGQYQQVMQHEMQQHHPQQPPPQAGDMPFPPQGQLGGQTFASTLLLSFSCAPLLKAHLMRTLHMNNEELASLEPVLAEAWERWDHARRAHYAEAVKAGIPVAPPGAGSYTIEIPQDPPPPGTYVMPPGAPNGPNPIDASSNEFRARFHRSLAAPTPFRTFAPASASAAEAQQQQQQQQATSTPNSVTSDPIDPHLSASSTVAQGTTTGAGKGNAKAAKNEKT